MDEDDDPEEQLQEGSAADPAEEIDNELAVYQAMLDARCQFWSSPAYEFFDKPLVVRHNGGIAHAFQCIKCTHVVFRMQDTLDSSSTGNLTSHIKKCSGKEELAAAAATYNLHEKFSSKALTNAQMRVAIVRWIAQNVRPVNIVQDSGFLRILRAGRKTLWVPAPSTVARDINTIYHLAVDQIRQMLRRAESRIHVTSDAWTSPNQLAFVAFLVHFGWKGKLRHVLLDIIDVPKSHTGNNLAAILRALLQRYSITEKFMTTTLDNASNNTVMVRNLHQKLGNTFKGEHAHGHCFAHVLNLIAKALLSVFDKKASGQVDDDADEEYELPDYRFEDIEIEQAVDEQDDDEDFSQFLDAIPEEGDETEGEGNDLDAQEVEKIGQLIGKLRKLSFKILHSTTKLRPAWYRILDELELSHRKLPRDVANRWNSTFKLLRFALIYKGAVNLMTERNRELHTLQLEGGDWVIVRQLKELLEVFDEATRFFSRTDFAGMCYVVRWLDAISTHLEEFIDSDAPEPLRAAARLGLAKLRKYQDLMLSKEVYQFATVFNPSIKLRFYEHRAEQFPPEWIARVKQRMAVVFQNEYMSGVQPSQPQRQGPSKPKTFSEQMFQTSPVKSSSSTRRNRTQAQDVITELDLYLASEPENTTDIIDWWFSRRDQFPHLYKMAIDYCSVPATTVDVERLLSTGRVLLSYLRNRLSGDSVHALLCLKSWWDAGIINDELFATHFEDIL